MFQTLQDLAGAVVTSSFCNLNIIDAPAVGCCSVVELAQGAPLFCSADAIGGSGLFVNWTLASGSLPSGISLDVASGNFAGFSNALPGLYNYTVLVFDSAGGYAESRNCSLAIVAPPVLQCPSLRAGVSSDYSSSLVVVSGGSASQNGQVFGVTALPEGLELVAETGLIRGVATTVGNVSFVANVTDASGGVGSVSCTLVVSAAPVLSCPLVSVVDLGSSVSSFFGISGGANPFNVQLVGGSLPTGLSLNSSTGLLSGVANVTSDTEFSVVVSDSLGLSSSVASCRIFVVISMNVTLWPRSCQSVSAGASTAWVSPNNLAQVDMPVSNAVDFVLPTVWASSFPLDASETLLCESFCADQKIPSDAFLAGISVRLQAFDVSPITSSSSRIAATSVSLYGSDGLVASASPRTPTFPFALTNLSVPTLYDLSFAKLEAYETLVGGSTDNWNLGTSPTILLDSNFGVGLRVSNMATTENRTANVFFVSVQVFFKTARPSFVPPLSFCPPVQAHDPDLPSRSVSCPPIVEAQCNVTASNPYSIVSTNCEKQQSPSFTVPVLIGVNASAVATCPYGQIFTRTWTECAPPPFAPFNLPPFGGFSCVQNITVVDTIAPVVTCPPDTLIECGAVEEGSFVLQNATASDACDGSLAVTRSAALVSTVDVCGLEQNITFRAVDRCGNEGTCTVRIRVKAITATLSCPPRAVVEGCAIPTPQLTVITGSAGCFQFFVFSKKKKKF